ncbi:cystatin-C-like isoform X2 [Conger conger]|uniref:cystatin-C-like isoform X2 n=1 Tax=Conger conger TaxID=82655 RepID=UPI002A5A8069|nr:cystatin-C-like isoform X2 [Conger conger]XP_061084098.1 cystatin-C-like isoform X2 [Conger conger]XP_061084099.1 cystatin-C-like isoform X2 [Conger conger]
MSPCLCPAVLAMVFQVARLAAASPVMTGAPFDVPPDRTDVLRAARFAVYEYNREFSDEEYAYKTTSIASSKVQVVAGLNFILDVYLALTQCKKISASDVENCPLQINGKKLRCHFVVLEVPWEEIVRLTERRCTADQRAQTYQTPHSSSASLTRRIICRFGSGCCDFVKLTLACSCLKTKTQCPMCKEAMCEANKI